MRGTGAKGNHKKVDKHSSTWRKSSGTVNNSCLSYTESSESQNHIHENYSQLIVMRQESESYNHNNCPLYSPGLVRWIYPWDQSLQSTKTYSSAHIDTMIPHFWFSGWWSAQCYECCVCEVRGCESCWCGPATHWHHGLHQPSHSQHNLRLSAAAAF